MRRLALLVVALLGMSRPAVAGFVTFESGQVRPLALAPSGSRLFATNTPDGQLEIFDVDASGIRHAASVPVGMEPIAVAARSETEVWVVNHLSDSVSVVQLEPAPPRVVRTLDVGDEPRDVVFAGPGRARAFVTAAHRGQHHPDDPLPTTPGVGRADVWVFDTAAGTPGGTFAEIVTLFGDTPRALAVSPDGSAVYVSVFQSGNQTTTLSEATVCDGGPTAPPCEVGEAIVPGGLPGPRTNVDGVPAPETGLIVRFDRGASQWRDPLGRDWSTAVPFALPDVDVFRLDAATLATTAEYAHVGTVLYGMAVNPVSGAVYVTNTEARNEVRFEGPGVFGDSTVRGHQHESQVTVLRDAGEVVPRHLNPHIDYDVVPSPPGVKERSLALPLGAAVSADGATLWVTAFGSGVVAAVDTAALEAGTFTPDTADHVTLTGGGPSGVVADEARDRLYVLTRFDDAVSVVDTASRREIAHVALHNPEPASVVAGRPLLYDARATSSNGEAACASCHIFGDNDGLGWDLGNPDAGVIPNPNLIHVGTPRPFHPMKGPMTTQSLRGMAAHGPMHWRGDRTGGNTPDGDAHREDQGFSTFIVAFEDLLGREAAIDDEAMARFGVFALELTYPPNPFRAFDGSLTPAQQAGRDLYFGRVTDQQFNCVGCHQLTPRDGLFGGDGQLAEQGGPQLFKIPHLRNLYTKVGMFRAPGPQVRGFGFTHDGSAATIDEFLATPLFRLTPPERRQLEEFLLAYDTNLAPVVGQQTTLSAADADQARLDLLHARAAAGDCELVAKGVAGAEARGWLGVGGGLFVSDRASEQPLDAAVLRALGAAPGNVVTYTCVPLGSGGRTAIDRDEDGFLDRDELDAGTNPADAGSSPDGIALPLARVGIRTTKLGLETKQGAARFAFTSKTNKDADGTRIAPPPRDTAFDPTTYGASLVVYGAGFTTDVVTHELPAAGWRVLGSEEKPKGYRFDGRKAGDGRVQRVVLKADTLTVKGAIPYSLDEPAQGRVAVRLVPGLFGEGGWCAVAPPKQRGKDRSTAKSDRPGRFVGAPGTAAPAVCPPLP
jgi:DNA-binding beta-propeller fold protein YncE